MKPTIGFIGLGAIGEPMCEHILAAGYSVHSCANRSRDAIERQLKNGLVEHDNAAQVAASSDILMSMVFSEDQNDQILRGEHGALAHMKPTSVIIVMSTVTPHYCQQLALEAVEKQIEVLDCPVSGLVSGAKAATLSMMVGGKPDVIERCRDVLSTMGNVMICGDVGAGQVVKLGNNAISLGSYSLIQEIRDTVAAAGVNLDTFMEILNESTGRSFVSQNFPMPKNRRPLGKMPTKDIGHCLQVAEVNQVDMPMLEACFKAGTAQDTSQ